MPIYEYRCEGCGEEQEVILRLADIDKPLTCACGATMARRIPRSGLVLTEDASWIESAGRAMVDPEVETPPRTRSEYKRMLKEKNLVPIG